MYIDDLSINFIVNPKTCPLKSSKRERKKNLTRKKKNKKRRKKRKTEI
jgi:hypothetical protein